MINLIRRQFVLLLNHRFSKIEVPENFGCLITAQAPVCLVTQSKNFVVEALLLSIAKQIGFIGLNPLHNSHTLCTDPKILNWASIHERLALGEVQTAPSMTFATFSIFLARGPIQTNPSQKLGFMKLFAAILRPRLLILIASKPVAHPVASKTSIQRMLKLEFYRSQKLLRGALFQPVEEQSKVILTGAEFDREIRVLAARSRQSPQHLLRMAKREFRRMAANPSFPVYWLLSRIAKLIIRRLFGNILVSGLEGVERAVREKTVILVPMHRSHLDYILVSYVLYKSKMNPPLVAAGINLDFWPVGYFIRGVGAYFIKRGARQDRLHTLLLRRYVSYLIKRGHLQEFFIEGGRSRSGRMLPPKVGLLNIMTEAASRGQRKDLLFIPVSISYEQVVEDNAYGKENTGQAKIRENFLSLIKATSILRRSYGDVVVQFGTPISFLEFKEQSNQRKEEERSTVVDLAHTIATRIQDQCSVTFSSLVCSALLAAPRYALKREQLCRRIRQLAYTAEATRELHSQGAQFSPSLTAFLNGKDSLIDEVVNSGIVLKHSCLGEEVFVLPGQTRFTADFYKNSSLHFFFEPALLGLLSTIGLGIEDPLTQTVQSLFIPDFLLPNWSKLQSRLRRCLEILVSKNSILSPSPIRFAAESEFFCPELLLGPMQSLLWVHLNIEERCRLGSSMAYDDLVKSLLSNSKAAMHLGLLARTEGASQSAVTSAIEGLSFRKLIEISELNGRAHEIHVLQDLSNERNLVRQINSALLATGGSRYTAHN